MKKISIFSLIIVVIDQLIKYIISHGIIVNHHISVIDSFFYIAHVRNKGAAWSILSGNRWLLIVIAFIALIVIYKTFIENNKTTNFSVFTYGLLIGGIIGNLLDRIIHGYVIDYLELIIYKYHYPIFNFADICIVVSVLFIIIKSIQEEVCKRKKLD